MPCVLPLTSVLSISCDRSTVLKPRVFLVPVSVLLQKLCAIEKEKLCWIKEKHSVCVCTKTLLHVLVSPWQLYTPGHMWAMKDESRHCIFSGSRVSSFPVAQCIMCILFWNCITAEHDLYHLGFSVDSVYVTIYLLSLLSLCILKLKV